MRVSIISSLLLAGTLSAAVANDSSLKKNSDGITLSTTNGFVKIQLCDDDIIRVSAAPDERVFQHTTLATEARRLENPHWKLTADSTTATLTTEKLRVKADLTSGAVTFCDTNGKPILAEQDRTMMPTEIRGEHAFSIRQQWRNNPDEALFGLGQQQLGLLDIKGYDLDLWQHNGTIVIPFLVSSRGYGIFWDNLSRSRFGDLREFTSIPAAQLFDKNGQPGGLTGSYFKGAGFGELVTNQLDAAINIAPDELEKKSPNHCIHPALPPKGDVSVRWEGEVAATETGDYQFQTFSSSGIKLWIDGALVINHWRQGWLPWFDLAKAHFVAGTRHQLKLEWSKDQDAEAMQLVWKTPSPEKSTSLWSESGQGVDYYFVYGPQLDRVIAGYRQLTGEVPMMPRWAYGFWQSRERYKTAAEITNVLAGFRARGIPLDNIVEDWQYWPIDKWGSHQFDPARFPDPKKWIEQIHDDYHAHLMVSVWGKFYPGTKNFDVLHTNGFLFEEPLRRGMKDWLGYPYTFYDAFNPAAGKMFWSQINRDLFSLGVDAWWMDASEPDIEQPFPTLNGTRDLMNPDSVKNFNAYALANSKTIYEGQRAAAPDQRAFLLTRSGFAGQQHYAGAVWSGDITTTWTALRKQIPAGLGYALSGMPYWTTDIGGFSVSPRWGGNQMADADREEWRELNTRWFEFGTFCPIFRAHGQFPFREMWNIAPESHPAYQAELKFDQLRYRLMPYIYSLGAQVTFASGTIMRPLVLDFQGDQNTWTNSDEFLFGPALLVSPVTEFKAREREVYLPTTSGGWFDFWTGENISGGQKIILPAPFDSIPLHVRAGSIIPIGPEIQFTGEKPADPITLYVYTGTDGKFTLYEDDGLTYGYEHGKFSAIQFAWADQTRTLTIGEREGNFPGLLKRRTFNVVVVSKEKPTGYNFSVVPDRTVKYTGKKIVLHF